LSKYPGESEVPSVKTFWKTGPFTSQVLAVQLAAILEVMPEESHIGGAYPLADKATSAQKSGRVTRLHA